MATGVPVPGGQMSADQLRAQNMAARQLVLGSALPINLPITQGSVTYTVGSPTVINVPVRPVGLVKRFWIKFTGTINAAATHSVAATDIGLANLLSQVVFTDLSNQTRINTAGWHLHMLASARRQFALGAAITSSDTTHIANNWGGAPTNFMTTPATVTGGTPANFVWYYELPVSYSDTDLTGAIWANTLNAAANIQLVINPNLFAPTASDGTLSAYIADAALATTLPTLTNITYTVYQDALDQLPVDPQSRNVILPTLDLEYAYLINNTTISALVANQPNSIPYANWRSFLSTFVMYDNFGFNGAGGVGSDMTSLSLQTANFTNTFQNDPTMMALWTRNKINDDFPASVGATRGTSVYYVDTRGKPINTVQYGNMSLLVQPATVQSASSVLYVGYESLALQGAMQQAGSLYQV